MPHETTTYTTATAFRQALEARLANISLRDVIDIQRLRRQVAFDRLLCRLFRDSNAPWMLKGGYAMELRLAESRTTRDIDLGTRRPLRGEGSVTDRIRTSGGQIVTDLLREHISTHYRLLKNCHCRYSLSVRFLRHSLR